MIVLQTHTDNVDSMVYSPDGRTLLTGSQDKSLKLWDLSTFKERMSFDTEGKRISAVDFSPDGSKVLGNPGRFFHDELVIWNVALGKQLQRIVPPSSPNHCLFSRDGRMVVCAGDLYFRKNGYPIWRYNLATGRARRAMYGHTRQIGYLAASPDGRLLVSGSMDQTARVWDLETGKELAKFSHRGWIYGLAFSPDSNTLATSSNQTIGLWDLKRWKKKKTLRGHKEKVRSLAFLPDGRTLLSAAEDGLVIFWDAATGQQMSVLDWKIKPLLTVAIAPDGMTAAAASAKGTVVLWDLDDR